MSEQQKTAETGKRWGNWCQKCGKEHENMGVEKCDCGGKTHICQGPPEIKRVQNPSGRMIGL